MSRFIYNFKIILRLGQKKLFYNPLRLQRHTNPFVTPDFVPNRLSLSHFLHVFWPAIKLRCCIQAIFISKFSPKISSRSSGASAISEGDIFMYSCSAQLISFEVDSISKEINCAEHEYMNMSHSLIALAPLLSSRSSR